MTPLLPLLLLLLPTLTAAQTADPQDPAGTNPSAAPVPPPGAAPPQLPWFDEVREQRRAAQALRRAGHEAQQDAHKDEFLRRRHERREFIAQERWLFQNYGPWLEPLAPPPAARPDDLSADDDPPGPVHPPPGWNNRWYYNGW